MYEIKTLGVLQYYTKFAMHFGTRMFSLTDSGYPTLFALGYCSHRTNEVVVCRIGNWRERLLHELGHVSGLKHNYTKGNIMHPWGLLRGMDGVNEIKTRLGYDYDYYQSFM